MVKFNYKQVDKAATKLLFPDLAKFQRKTKQIQDLQQFAPTKKKVKPVKAPKFTP